eukprot:9133080-Pyramimonas_sp.AAC.1
MASATAGPRVPSEDLVPSRARAILALAARRPRCLVTRASFSCLSRAPSFSSVSRGAPPSPPPRSRAGGDSPR